MSPRAQFMLSWL